jgi:hypothetical protein
MKKVFVSIIVLVLLSIFAGNVLAAPATVVKTTYGYYITGGNSETVVYAGLLRAKTVQLNAASIGDTVLFKEGAVSHNAFTIKAATASDSRGNYAYFGETGAIFNYLSVTMSSASDEVFIFNN